MISAEQRAIETVANMNISHSDICMNAPYVLLTFYVFQHRVSGTIGGTTQ